jgi:hypothetical protein
MASSLPSGEPLPPPESLPSGDALPRGEPSRSGDALPRGEPSWSGEPLPPGEPLPSEMLPRSEPLPPDESAWPRASDSPPFPGEWVRQPGHRPRPARLRLPAGAPRMSWKAQPRHPLKPPPGLAGGRRSRQDRRPRWLALVVTGVLGFFTVAAAGIIFYSHFRAPRSQHNAANPAPSSQMAPSATHSASHAQAPASPGAALFPAVAGVGCGARAGTAAEQGTRSQDGDGWQAVQGGLTACGGKALATRKTGTMGLVADTYTWTFHTGGAKTCTAQVFVAGAGPSSGIARYDVFGNSLAPGTAIGQFVINQGAAKGQWVRAGTWQVNGALSIQLTDAPNFPGDTFHVTASAVKLACS